MDWKLLGSCIVAAEFGLAVLYCVRVGIRALRKQSATFLLAFSMLAVGATLSAQKTNNVPNLNAPLPQMQQGEAFQTGFTGCTTLSGSPPPSSLNPVNLVNPVKNNISVQATIEDVARGWRIESVTTNAAVSYAMPTNATIAGNFHVHGAASSFGNNRIDFGDFAFPIGTNNAAFSTFWYFVDGRIRPTPRDAAREICAVGAPMSAVPGQSRLWTAEEPDGARVITWDNFFLGGDTNCPVNAQIRLYANGDFTTRSNDVETVCRRVNPDDWDDDGLANVRDADPLVCDGDFFGVANALPTNANPDAYYWLDLSVTGLLGVATVRVTCDGPSDLGDHVIIARTNQVFHVPLLAGATYAVESDLPIDYSSVSSEYAEIVTNAENRLAVSLPLELTFELVQMHGGSDSYIPHTSPVDVGPRISNITGGCCSCVTNDLGFSWFCSEGCNCSGRWHNLEASAMWGGYNRAFAWSGWCPCIWHDEGGQNEDAPRLVLAMPRTLFTNGDGGAEPSDVVRLTAGLFSPVATNGTLTLDAGLGEFANVWTTSSRTERVNLPVTWNVADEPCRIFYIEGAEEIERSIDLFSLAWRDGDGNAIMSTNHDFAVYYPKVNVVNNSLFDGGDLCNPAGIVTGTNACFAIEFCMVHPPANEIRWSIVEGNAQFVGGETGERVRVASTVPNQRVTLRVNVDDCKSRPPEISAYVVDPLVVKLTVWIVGNKNGSYYAQDAATVSNMVADVNKIYEQIGVSFYVDSISCTNRRDWLVLHDQRTRKFDKKKRRELVNVEKNTGGLELYFVDYIDARTVANHDVFGIVVSKRGDANVLAHEIGHAFGCADVYSSLRDDDDTHLPNAVVCESRQPLDWSNGTGCRYYATGISQETIIGRLLMCGVKGQGQLDLSSGSIYGFSKSGETGLIDVGVFRSGERRSIMLHR